MWMLASYVSAIHRALLDGSQTYEELALRHRLCCDGAHVAIEVMETLEALTFLALAGMPTDSRAVARYLNSSLRDVEMLLLAASEAQLVSFHP